MTPVQQCGKCKWHTAEAALNMCSCHLRTHGPHSLSRCFVTARTMENPAVAKRSTFPDCKDFCKISKSFNFPKKFNFPEKGMKIAKETNKWIGAVAYLLLARGGHLLNGRCRRVLLAGVGQA